jgi:hypothetical protein
MYCSLPLFTQQMQRDAPDKKHQPEHQAQPEIANQNSLYNEPVIHAHGAVPWRSEVQKSRCGGTTKTNSQEHERRDNPDQRGACQDQQRPREKLINGSFLERSRKVTSKRFRSQFVSRQTSGEESEYDRMEHWRDLDVQAKLAGSAKPSMPRIEIQRRSVLLSCVLEKKRAQGICIEILMSVTRVTLAEKRGANLCIGWIDSGACEVRTPARPETHRHSARASRRVSVKRSAPHFVVRLVNGSHPAEFQSVGFSFDSFRQGRTMLILITSITEHN